MKSKGNGAVVTGSALWQAHFVSARLPERDDPRDEVETSDLRAVANPEIEIDLTKCLGLCTMPASVCAICQIANGKPRTLVVQKKPKSANSDVVCGQSEARSDIHLSAPMSRGRRGILAV